MKPWWRSKTKNGALLFAVVYAAKIFFPEYAEKIDALVPIAATLFGFGVRDALEAAKYTGGSIPQGKVKP